MLLTNAATVGLSEGCAGCAVASFVALTGCSGAILTAGTQPVTSTGAQIASSNNGVSVMEVTEKPFMSSAVISGAGPIR